MQRRVKAFLLFAFLLLPMVAPMLLWYWQDYSLKKDYAASVQQADVVIEVCSLDELKWMDGREELQIGKEYYDVVSIKKNGSRYQVALKSDSLETAVMEVFASQQKKQAHGSYLFCYIGFYLPVENFFSFESPLSHLNQWKKYVQYSFSIYLNQLSPPPDLFCC